PAYTLSGVIAATEATMRVVRVTNVHLHRRRQSSGGDSMVLKTWPRPQTPLELRILPSGGEFFRFSPGPVGARFFAFSYMTKEQPGCRRCNPLCLRVVHKSWNRRGLLQWGEQNDFTACVSSRGDGTSTLT